MSNYNSKSVTSLQNGVHENLLKYLKRYSLDNYRRPVRDFTLNNIELIKNWSAGEKFVLDLCCGVGESTYKLAEKFECKVLGVDKSISRISRKNSFKVKSDRVLLVQDDVFDLIPLLHEHFANEITQVHIYYPNPWPKKTQLKRRLHANPVAPFLFALSDKFILRSNWKIYLEEFAFSAEYYLGKKKEPQILEELDSYITPFERKYHLSGQKIYELNIL